MNSQNSEIIIFLPISQMYRFSKGALRDESNKSFKPLKRFIEDFLQIKYNIEECKNQIEYIHLITEAFSLKEYLDLPRTNNDIYFFTLKKGFLPKHINIVLKSLQENLTFDRKIRKNSFYINYKQRRYKI